MSQTPAAAQQRVLAGVAAEVEAIFASVTRVGEAASTLLDGAAASGQPPVREDLQALRPHIAAVLRRHEGLTAGAGVVLAPEVLADAPRCIEWWWGDRGAGLERLEVDLDPDSAEFYDYTTEDWYREPQRSARRCIAGPYVDYICTREYTFTLSVPLLCGGRFAGVAGADILAAQVEHALVPALSRLGGTAVLASANGRVIASNSSRFLPGTVLAGDGGERLVAVAGAATSLPWTLLERAR